MNDRGRPTKPEEKRHRNQRVIRLNDFFESALLEIADEDGVAPATLGRKFIQEGIRRRLKEKRVSPKNDSILTV